MTDTPDHDHKQGLEQAPGEPLPQIETGLSIAEIQSRLLALSKRGKLAGYNGDDPDGIASVAAHGTPFDSKLVLLHSGHKLSFACKLLPMMPRVFAALLIITVWPGLPLTDQFLSSLQWYAELMARIGIDTWVWYLPLTILPAPFALRSAIRKSRATAHQSALEAIEKIRGALS